MAKAKIIGHPWRFDTIWNKALDSFPERALQARSHIWASELGGSYITRYLRMNAVPYTNPPNARSRRKFMSGDIWEWIVKMVLTTSGILKAHQERTEVELPGLLKVTGKIDFLAGGDVDWDKAKSEISRMEAVFGIAEGDVPAFVTHAMVFVVDEMKKLFKNKPLMLVPFECKSLSTEMMKKVEKKGALAHNVLQLGHYIIGTKINTGYLVYICRSDTICNQFEVDRDTRLARLYRADVEHMTNVYNNGFNNRSPLKLAPPKDAEVLFDPVLFRFEKNFQVEYSPYLTMLYNYETPEDFRMRWANTVTNYNRVFKRLVKGENVTDKNKIVIAEVTKWFPDWDKYIYKAKAEGAFSNDEE
jgi:hypothetical protein